MSHTREKGKEGEKKKEKIGVVGGEEEGDGKTTVFLVLISLPSPPLSVIKGAFLVPIFTFLLV